MADFKLWDDEAAAFARWDREHLDKFHGGEEPYAGAIGGRVGFVVTETSLGQIVTAYCSICKTQAQSDNGLRHIASDRRQELYEKCLTDFDCW